MSELKPMTLEELKRYDKLKKYRHNARHAIKDLQRQLSIWKEIAQKYMAMSDRWRAEYHAENTKFHLLCKQMDEVKGIVPEQGPKKELSDQD